MHDMNQRERLIVTMPPRDDTNLVMAMGRMLIAFGRLEDMVKILQARAENMDIDAFIRSCGQDKITAHKILQNLGQHYDASVVEQVHNLFKVRNDFLHSAYMSDEDGRYIRLREGTENRDLDQDIKMLTDITQQAGVIISQLADLRPIRKDIKLEVATCLLFDKDDKLLIYLRDDKPMIPFPNHWDLFGGFIEDGETAEQALVREIKEELGIVVLNYVKLKEYDCSIGDVKPNIKHVYYAKTEHSPENLELLECGQRLTSIALDERHNYKFANILGRIIDDYAASQKAVA